ncbi:MAG: Mov34/MPN/PAD-1 family protein, partial [Actinomycetota bacterium]
MSAAGERGDDHPLGPEALSEVFSHCADAYPDEACGFVCATGRVRKCRNAQDEFHARDTDRYPRNAANGYAISLSDAVFLDASLSSDDPVRVVFHSHPDADAYLSDEDIRSALVDGSPILPVYHLVVAVQGAAVAEARLYRFIERAFIEIDRFDRAGASVA